MNYNQNKKASIILFFILSGISIYLFLVGNYKEMSIFAVLSYASLLLWSNYRTMDDMRKKLEEYERIFRCQR